MDSLTETAPTPAPYGHACANCAQSKCRCILHRVGGPCERCRRLNKECRPAETVRRRNPRKVTVSKTARLEEKLDGLVSLIKAGQSGRDTASSSLNGYKQSVPMLTPPTDESIASSHPSPVFQDISGEPSPAEAEECLISFKKYNSKYFPFVYIPSAITARELQQERPFLWLSIMAVCTKSTARQQALSSKIRQTVAQEMILEAEKNIDLLLGLLTFIGWGHYQFYAKPSLVVFTQLAISLVYDLGFNKPVFKVTNPVLCLKEKRWYRPFGPRTTEERRAVLGCFLITSIVSSYLQKTDALQWTPHMDECLQMIDEGKECLNDDVLVKQVRLQLMAERTVLDTLHDEAAGSIEHMKDPTPLRLEMLYPKLQEYKTKLLAQPRSDKVVLLHLHNIELEIALTPDFLHTNKLTPQQRKHVNIAFKAIESWLDVFLTIPPNDYVGFSFPIFSQLLRCLVTLYQLKTPENSDFGSNEAGKNIDLVHIMDLITSKLEQVPIVADLENIDDPGMNVFTRSSNMFRSLRPVWEAGLSQVHLSTISQNLSETFPPDPLSVDLFDNDWLMDLFLTPNY